MVKTGSTVRPAAASVLVSGAAVTFLGQIVLIPALGSVGAPIAMTVGGGMALALLGGATLRRRAELAG